VPRLQRGLWQAAALAVLAHAAVLSQLPSLRPAAPWGQGGSGLHPFQTRVIPLPAPVEMPAAALPAPEALSPAPAAATPAPPPRPAVAAVAPPATLPPAGTPSGSTAFSEAPYLTRDRLTAAPYPLTSVDVEFPADVAGIVDMRVKVTLFIDEQGLVRRVQLDSPDVPPSFARAINETFASARFKPGEVDGTKVRSRIRMEIEFRAPGAGQPSMAGGLSAPVDRTPPSLRSPSPP